MTILTIDPTMSLFAYSFFINALLASVLASITCGIAGTYIVARRMVFIGGGITHASFGGIGIAWFLGLNPLLGAAVFSVLAALGIEFAAHKTNIREDSAIGILWSLGMAMGIIFIFLTPGFAPNLMSYLFGNILTVGNTDLWLMALLAAILVAFFTFFYYPVLFIAFDEEYARSHNLPVQLFKYVLISLVAVTIVLNIRVTGIILVISFLTIPASVANIYTNNFRKIMVGSIFIGIAGSFAGLFCSYYWNIPSGATIIFSFVLIFALAKLFHWIRLKQKIKLQLLKGSSEITE